MNSEELDLLSDSKYRQFISAVEKALKGFDYTTEWADLISALGKLNKVLMGHTKFPVVPRKLTIGKRLAQCMHPNLPSGVHLKALETYDLVFKRIGPKGLSQDLFTYSAGLFPLLGQAAMSVKPVLLGTYENYFIPLGKALLPGLSGFILGLLPGIEEGSEYTERTVSLLESVCHCTDKQQFFGTLWQCIETSASVRLSGTTFILSRLSKNKTIISQQFILGNDLDIMIQAVCSCLGDTNVLVQRNALDFILQVLPLHSDLIPRRLKGQLTQAGLEVLLRREMSLNRRLYTWILGTNGNEAQNAKIRNDSVCSTEEQDGNGDQSYFSLNSRHLVTKAIKTLFQQPVDPDDIQSTTGKKALRLEILKPFRILITLLDRPEIGSVILEDVLLEVFRALQNRCGSLKDQADISDEQYRRDSIESVISTTSVPNTDSIPVTPSVNFTSSNKVPLVEELIKTANILFNVFEPYFMWEYIAKLIVSCGKRAEEKLSETEVENSDAPVTNYSEIFHLTEFILDNVLLEAEVEAQTEYWPELLRKVTIEMTARCEIMSLTEIREGIYLCSKLLSKVMPTMTTVVNQSQNTNSTEVVAKTYFDEPKEEDFKNHLEKSTGEIDGAPKQADDKHSASGSSISLEEKESEGEKSSVNGTGSERKLESPVFNNGQKQTVGLGSERRKSETPSTASSEGIGDKMDERVVRNLVANEIKEEKQDESNGQDSQEWCIIQDKERIGSDVEDDDENEEWDDFQDAENPEEFDKEVPENLTDNTYLARQDSLINKSDTQRLTPSQHLFQPFIKSCVLNFQAFFGEFVEHWVLKCKNRIDSSGVSDPVTACDETDPSLSINLLVGKKTFALRQNLWRQNPTHKNHKKVGVYLTLNDTDSIQCSLALTAACKLLVELSCFPVYCEENGNELEEKLKHQGMEEQLPEWLQSLILCCLDIDDFAIQSCAIGTLLDLINLTLSVAPVGTGTKSRESTAVVVIPMISQALLTVIEQSEIYQLISQSLWARLQESNTRCHQRIVELFLQLHHLTPNAALCQNVITNSLVHQDKEQALSGHWKFSVFWHIARNITVQDSGRCSNLGQARTLDNALFAMLDSLGSEEPEIRIIAQYWISHALQHGDLGRVLDPLLLLLLHPATTREAIHYFNQPRELEKQQSVEKQGQVLSESVTDVKNGNSGESRVRSTSSSSNSGRPQIPSSETDIKVVKCSPEEKEKAEKQLSVEKPRTLSSSRGHGHVQPLDQHKLLYLHLYDSQRTLYAFKCLMVIMRSAAHQFTCAISTTSLSSSNTPHQQRIKELLVRHRRALIGKGFYGPLYESPVSSAGSSSQAGRLFGGPWMYLRPNTSKYLEILISVCLYFIRSHYPSHLLVEPSDNAGNLEVQIASTELLTCLVWQLVSVVNESGSAYGTFVSDLFSRCKVQKALVHCLVSTVYNRPGYYGHLIHSPSTPTSPSHTCTHPISESQAKVLQIKLLRLLQAILILEDCIQCTEPSNPDGSRQNLPPASPSKQEEKDLNTQDRKTTNTSQRFMPDLRLSSQGMLLSVVLHGLKHDTYDLRHEWLRFVLACLPHMREDLHKWVTPVVQQICYSLREIAIVHRSDERRFERNVRVNLPPDYMVTLLDTLTSICQYCLTDNTPSSPVLSLQPRSGSVFPVASSLAPAIGESGIQSGNSVHIFSNLLHAFSVQSDPVSNAKDMEKPNPVYDAREKLLSILPTILTSLITVWNTWQPETSVSSSQCEAGGLSLNHIGAPKVVRQHILQLLTPVAMNHTIVLLASLADVWHQRRRRERGDRRLKITPEVSDEQKVVVEIVYAIKALSFEDTIKTVKKILRQVVTSKDKTKGTGTTSQLNLEVSILQFLYEYLKKASLSQLTHTRSSLIALIKEGLQLNLPPALFLLLVILHSCVQRFPLHEDRKMRKELQDITQKLIESCNTVAGSSLESAAWFRRSLAVIPQAPVTTSDDQSSSAFDSELSESESTATSNNTTVANNNSSNYSTQALVVLSELLAPLLDVMFGSEEKDRVTSLLTTVMYNVTPYLKNHGPQNLPSFRACCSLLASLSGYQYTRRAWKKDVMELLLDSGFFQMDIACIGSWRTIIDNLMTQDNTSFKDLMSRVAGSASQGTAINIFANREQEMEQRAQLLKKLSFTVFCSEPDQYQPCMPEIQERLAESLRLPQAPVLLEQVFLFFRVLLLRMPAHHLVSLWPVMVSELVHVLLQLENDLSCDGKSQSQRMVISEALLGTNGCYMAYNQEKWLGLYLGACKLLDLAVALPTDELPYFQMYRWAFQGDLHAAQGNTGQSGIFKPHIARVCKLLRKRGKRFDGAHVSEGPSQHSPGKLFLTMYSIKSIDQLLPFFEYLTRGRTSNGSTTGDEKAPYAKPTKISSARTLIERVVERDFLEPLVAD